MYKAAHHPTVTAIVVNGDSVKKIFSSVTDNCKGPKMLTGAAIQKIDQFLQQAESFSMSREFNLRKRKPTTQLPIPAVKEILLANAMGCRSETTQKADIGRKVRAEKELNSMKKRLDESQAKLRKAIEQNKELKCLVKTEIASLRKKVAVAETTVADL